MLKLDQVASGYRQTPVIQEISLTIEPGEVVGLLGLNGAGKSTLLKTILGLLPLQAGQMTLNGQTLTDDFAAYTSQIAYIPETPILYEELTLQEHLEMTALGYDLPLDQVMERAQPLLELFRLDQHMNWFPSHFSKGMKQKVMLVNAFVLEAQLLIIDEPFLGLDPLAIQDLIHLLQERSAAGVSILFTTHVLSAATSFCDRFLMMRDGRLVADGSLSQLSQEAGLPEEDLDALYLHLIGEDSAYVD